jgi:hypothetical protein
VVALRAQRARFCLLVPERNLDKGLLYIFFSLNKLLSEISHTEEFLMPCIKGKPHDSIGDELTDKLNMLRDS